MAQPEDGWLGFAFLLVNNYVGNRRKLSPLPRMDEAARDFWYTFYTLRIWPVICGNLTPDELGSKLDAFMQNVVAPKYVVFFFIGHGGDGDHLYLQDGHTVTTKEIDQRFSALPKSTYRIFFIDACRGENGYCPEYPNSIVARSTLPYHKAQRADTYGTCDF